MPFWIWTCTVWTYEIFVFLSGPPDIFMSDRRSKIVVTYWQYVCFQSVNHSFTDWIQKEDIAVTGISSDGTSYINTQTIAQQNSLHFLQFSLLYKKVIQNPTTLHSMMELVRKKCSCITDCECCFLALYSGSLFLDEDHKGDSQYWGLTVGGHTRAHFRKVQIILGQSGQGVQELMPAVGTSREGGLVGISGWLSRNRPWTREDRRGEQSTSQIASKALFSVFQPIQQVSGSDSGWCKGLFVVWLSSTEDITHASIYWGGGSFGGMAIASSYGGSSTWNVKETQKLVEM